MAKLKGLTIPNVGGDMKQLKLSYIADRTYKMVYNNFANLSSSFSYTLP